MRNFFGSPATTWTIFTIPATFVLSLFVQIHHAYAAFNTTVDDFNPQISYVPPDAWNSVDFHSDRIDGTTHWTNVEGAYAEFTFNGASKIYYVGFGISDGNTLMSIVLDGTTYIVDMARPFENRAQAYLWNSGNLDPLQSHTIRCLKTTPSGHDDMNLDAFILTIPDGLTASGPSSTPSTQPPTSPTTSNASGSSSSTSGTMGTDPSSTTNTTLATLFPSNGSFGSSDAGNAHNDDTTTPATDAQASAPHQINLATVVGGTLGGVAFLIVIVAFVLLRRRLNRESEKRKRITDIDPDYGAYLANQANGRNSGPQTSTTTDIDSLSILANRVRPLPLQDSKTSTLLRQPEPSESSGSRSESESRGLGLTTSGSGSTYEHGDLSEYDGTAEPPPYEEPSSPRPFTNISAPFRNH